MYLTYYFICLIITSLLFYYFVTVVLLHLPFVLFIRRLYYFFLQLYHSICLLYHLIVYITSLLLYYILHLPFIFFTLLFLHLSESRHLCLTPQPDMLQALEACHPYHDKTRVSPVNRKNLPFLHCPVDGKCLLLLIEWGQFPIRIKQGRRQRSQLD